MTTPVPPAFGSDLAPWISGGEVAARPGVADLSLSGPQLDAAALAATRILYALSGRRWPGVRSATLRLGAAPGASSEGLPHAGAWPFTGGPLRHSHCGRTDLDPQLAPIVEVQEVRVGDVVVPAEQVEVVNGQTIRLRRAAVADPLAVNHVAGPDGWYSLWPGGCSCGGPAEAVVAFTWGAVPPSDGVFAALSLAVELAKASAGKPCRLPGNVISVQRQGVSVLLDPSTYLDKGRTGVPDVDLWISTVNPHGLRAAATLWSPDEPTPERVL